MVMANVRRPGACEQCGRPLPEQQGAGRTRRYCSSTCRSRARRGIAATGSPGTDVNDPLTDPARKEILDKVLGEFGKAPGDPAADPSAEAGRDLVRRMLSGRSAGALEAISVAQSIVQGAEEGLAMTVRQAREAGHTWAEVGQRLGTSRQAAFQRFGRPADPRTGLPMEPVLPDAGERALELLDDLADGRWAAVCARFNATVAAKLDAEGLAAVWAQVIGMVGACERRDAPQVFAAGDYAVVDVPLSFEAGERTARISYDREGRVAGLFFLPRGIG
jgi:Protein of unknown function (DUF3887)